MKLSYLYGFSEPAAISIFVMELFNIREIYCTIFSRS